MPYKCNLNKQYSNVGVEQNGHLDVLMTASTMQLLNGYHRQSEARLGEVEVMVTHELQNTWPHIVAVISLQESALQLLQ